MVLFEYFEIVRFEVVLYSATGYILCSRLGCFIFPLHLIYLIHLVTSYFADSDYLVFIDY